MLKLPGSPALPPVDDHIVRPETREELVRGERVLAAPALEPHGDQHFSLDYILGAHLREAFIGSTDLLTRSAFESDFATDTCIRRRGTDPDTGHRYLEEVAFEVVHEQPYKKVAVRAEDLVNRGVRRVFAIFVKTGQVKEWLPVQQAFASLPPDGFIVDACFVKPLSVKALVDAAAADNEVARALDAKDNPVIKDLKAQSETRGEERATAAAVLAVLEARGIHISEAARETIQRTTDITILRAWLVRASTAQHIDEAIDPAL